MNSPIELAIHFRYDIKYIKKILIHEESPNNFHAFGMV